MPRRSIGRCSLPDGGRSSDGCAEIALAYHFIVFPLFGNAVEKYTGFPLVDLAWNELSVILMGMLGFGGIRAYEKVKGVARNSLRG